MIPGADSLIGDLLDMDLGPPMHQQQAQMYTGQPLPSSGAGMDIFGEGLDTLVRKYAF